MAKLKSVRLSRRAIKVLEGIDTRFKEPLKEAIREIAQPPSIIAGTCTDRPPPFREILNIAFPSSSFALHRYSSVQKILVQVPTAVIGAALPKEDRLRR